MEPVSSRLIYQAKNFYLCEEDYSLPGNVSFSRTTIRHPGAVVFIPQLPSGELLLVDQLRPALGKKIIEFPAGTLEPGEEPLQCAKREIMEEVRFEASSWLSLGSICSAPGFTDEILHCFFASDLSPGELPRDEDEYLDVITLSAAEVEKRIGSGVIIDAKTISIFYRAKLNGLL